MKIVVAADKFKGALNSFEVCNAIAQGLLQASTQFSITALPLSDGGDGLCDVLSHYTNTKTVVATVHDPLFRPIQARYLLTMDGHTAFIEMAQASGLQRLQPREYNPMLTSSFGTGELVKHALQHGVSKIVLGIGGSATNDGGIGLAAALGYRFLDKDGLELKPIGQNLKHIHTIDASGKWSTGDVEIVVACDVTAYLTGAEGASIWYSPQKGATAAMAETLEEGMQHFAEVAKQQLGIDITKWKSGGAAGGMGAGAMLFLGAHIISGVALLLEYSQAEHFIQAADWVITGEGKLDAQTTQGKLIHGVVEVSRRHQKPVLAMCGTLALDAAAIEASGLTAAFSIINQPMSLESAIANTTQLLKDASYNLGNFFKTAYHFE